MIRTLSSIAARAAAAALLGMAAFAAMPAKAQECRKLQEVCVEGKETRLISGINVTRDCWRYESTYECLKPNSVDYCAPLVQAAPVCYQTSVTCAEKAFNGSCIKETKTFRCDDVTTSQPPNTVKLDDSYIFVDKEPDMEACKVQESPDDKPPALNKRCTLAEKVCTSGPETRTIDGLPVYRDCWAWDYKYACLGDDWHQMYCEELKKDPACHFVGTQCVDWDNPRGCTLKEDRYECITQQGSTQTVQDCSTKSACVNGVCWETGSPPDGDFAMAVIANEVGRQAGIYKTDDFRLFKGVAESCREGWGGLKQCCDESPGGQTNNSILKSAGMSTVQMIGKEAMNVGSKWVYDFMFDEFTKYGYESMAGAMWANGYEATSYATSFEMYGFGWSSAGAGEGAIALGEGGFYFDPTSFAIAVAIQVIMELMSCEPEEQTLGMHRGDGLSHYVGSYCSKKVLGGCVQRSQAYCSFNSKLAKIINVQGRAQIGRSFGPPEAPDCSGFTIADFQKIDFSRIDFSEFVDDIMAGIDKPDGTSISTTIANKLKGKSTNVPTDNTPKLPIGYDPNKPPGGS